MQIQSYQIHNVLNVYRRQLSQMNPDRDRLPAKTDPGPDSIRISAEGKNLSVMEKVADNVIKKITALDPGADFEKELTAQVSAKESHVQISGREQHFVFNTIGGDNRKETRSIAVDDSLGLMNRLNELAQAAVNRKAE